MFVSRSKKPYRDNVRHRNYEVNAQCDKSVQQRGVGLAHGQRAAQRGAQVSVVAGVDDLAEQLRGSQGLDPAVRIVTQKGSK